MKTTLPEAIAELPNKIYFYRGKIYKTVRAGEARITLQEVRLFIGDREIYNILLSDTTVEIDSEKYDFTVTEVRPVAPAKVSVDKLKRDEVYRYELDGVLHREDGPAVLYMNGDKVWYSHGKIHREGGPAKETVQGTKEWYIHGKHHREDGPAIEFYSGMKVWFMNGERHREDGPAVEFPGGGKQWYFRGKFHREDGPAVEWSDGDKEWYLHGKLHRGDGPAIEKTNGYKAWYLYGVPFRNYTDKNTIAALKNSIASESFL